MTVCRKQLPLVLAYAYTDYKSQGRTLERAVVDLASASSMQSVYVMISRVKTMEGLAVLRWFNPGKIYQRHPQDLRDEFVRIESMNKNTLSMYELSLSC